MMSNDMAMQSGIKAERISYIEQSERELDLQISGIAELIDRLEMRLARVLMQPVSPGGVVGDTAPETSGLAYALANRADTLRSLNNRMYQIIERIDL